MSKFHASLFFCFKVFILSVLPLSVYAHTGAESLVSMADGFMHPFLGIDHLFVMIAIGMWAGILGRYRLWLLPLVFLLAMFLGAMLSFKGFEINGMEHWVALSILVFGFILRQVKDISTILACSLVSVFALGHGYVHAEEMVSGGVVEAYAVGFLFSTAIILTLGISSKIMGSVALIKIQNIFAFVCTLVGIAILAGS